MPKSLLDTCWCCFSSLHVLSIFCGLCKPQKILSAHTEMAIPRGSSPATSENHPEPPCPQTKNHLSLIHPNSSCHMSRACPRIFRTCAERWGFELFQVQRYPQTAPDECEESHTRNEQEGSCVSDSMSGLWFSLHWRDWQVTKEENNRAQICSKDWRPEEWSGGACMRWRTQGGLKRSKDPWVRTTLPEEKSPRSHLDKEDQHAGTRIWTVALS